MSNEPTTKQEESSVETFHEKLNLIIKKTFVEKFIEGDERPCDHRDFTESKKIREKLTSDINILIENFLSNEEVSSHLDIKNDLLASIIVICGQNITKSPWNTESTVKNCEQILFQISKFCNCKNVFELVSKNRKLNLIKDIFQTLKPDLTASTWKHFPASITCYKWILEMIKEPELSRHLHFLLPPTLLLIDDYVVENRIIGVKCALHIVQNLTIAELQLYGHGEVIYNALLPLLRIRESSLISSIILPLITVASKLEYDLGNKNPTKWSRLDSILEIYLENMELEQLIDLRYCYISNLEYLITTVEYGIIRWSKRLLKIFLEYIQTAWNYNDEKTNNHCVKAMEKYISFSSDVSSLHAEQLICILLIGLHHTNNLKSEISNESREIIIRNIKVLLKSVPPTNKEKLKEVFKERFSSIHITDEGEQ